MNITTDVRLLLLVGIICAGCATYSKNSEKAFGLWSQISSLCIGASIGILKETTNTTDHDDRY